MRVRINNPGQNTLYSVARCGYVGQNPTTWPRYRYVTPYYGYIADEKSAWTQLSTGQRIRSFGQCNHYSWNVSTSSSMMHAACSGGWYCDYPTYSMWCSKFHAPNSEPDPGFELFNAAMDQTPSPFTGHYDRWMAVRPTMATRANLSVFLYELRDLKRMFEILPKKHFSLRSWKNLLEYINNQHLNYNFGWKPFLRDIKNTFRGMSSFEQRLNKFLREQNLSVHRRKCDGDVDVSVVQNFTSPIEPEYWTMRREITGKYRLCSSFLFSYSSPYTGDGLRWRAWLDTLGLDVSPANIWAVLPWSFVVDWFINIGPALQTLSDDWTHPWVNFHQCGTSLHYEFSVSDTVKCVQSGCNTVEGKAVTVSGKSYVRYLAYPHFQLEIGTLNADKIRLLASLFGSLVI